MAREAGKSVAYQMNTAVARQILKGLKQVPR
jgi:hypothetical protein